MESIGKVSRENICPIEDAGGPPPHTVAYTVKGGDTLSKLAARLQQQGVPGTREVILGQILTLNPHITHADLIHKGETLRLPGGPGSTAHPEGPEANRTEAFRGRPPASGPRTQARSEPHSPAMTAGTLAFLGKAAKPAPTFLRSNGEPFPVSQDGTPRYKQNDREVGGNWGATLLGEGDKARSIGSKGCAMTAVAMALSKLSGETLTPDKLDAYLDTHGGYSRANPDKPNNLLWGVAGKAVSPPLTVTKTTAWSLEAIQASLDAGRPVVLGVDYKDGPGTDHWVCLTRREAGPPDTYFANDPATGGEIRLQRQPDGTLQRLKTGPKDPVPAYRSTGEFVTFAS
jgi:hypothetical protein